MSLQHDPQRDQFGILVGRLFRLRLELKNNDNNKDNNSKQRQVNLTSYFGILLRLSFRRDSLLVWGILP